VEIGQIRASQRHPVQQLSHLELAALLDISDLTLVAVASRALT
jgi:hypothetical protein